MLGSAFRHLLHGTGVAVMVSIDRLFGSHIRFGDLDENNVVTGSNEQDADVDTAKYPEKATRFLYWIGLVHHCELSFQDDDSSQLVRRSTIKANILTNLPPNKDN